MNAYHVHPPLPNNHSPFKVDVNIKVEPNNDTVKSLRLMLTRNRLTGFCRLLHHQYRTNTTALLKIPKKHNSPIYTAMTISAVDETSTIRLCSVVVMVAAVLGNVVRLVCRDSLKVVAVGIEDTLVSPVSPLLSAVVMTPVLSISAIVLSNPDTPVQTGVE